MCIVLSNVFVHICYSGNLWGYRIMKVILTGNPASLGTAVGRPKIVHTEKDMLALKQGEVLVAEMTSPEYVPAMKRAVAIITERGGRTCHAAIVSRELGVPCIVGAEGAVEILGKIIGVVTVKVEITGGEVLV